MLLINLFDIINLFELFNRGFNFLEDYLFNAGAARPGFYSVEV